MATTYGGHGLGGYGRSSFDEQPFANTYATPGWQRAQQRWARGEATRSAPHLVEGEMTAREYALESMMYRTAGLIDHYIDATPDKTPGDGTPMLKAFEEFAVEASIAKVLGSETVDYIIDENVQIHGGNGFVHDYPAEGHYRDARVNRIFEGTNEINRLLIPGMLMKKALKGELPLLAAAKALQDEVMSPSMPVTGASDEVLGDQARAVAAFKKVVLLVAGTAMQRYGAKIEQEQEVQIGRAHV